MQAESAGIATLKGESIAPNASAVLEEIGVYVTGHHARQVSEEILQESDLVLTMGLWHIEELRRVPGGSLREVYTLLKYVSSISGEEEVPDPYGSTMTAFRASVRQLLEYVELLVGRLSVRGRPSPTE